MSNRLFRLCLFPLIASALLAAVPLVQRTAMAETDPKARHKKIQEKIRKGAADIEKVKKEEKSVLGELDGVTRKLIETRKRLDRQKKKVRSTKKKISSVQAEIKETKKRIKKRQEWIRRKLRAAYKYGAYADYIVVLGTAGGVEKTMRRLKYLEALSANEREKIQEFRSDLTALKENEAELQGLYSKLDDERKAISRSESALKKSKKQKSAVLASVRSEKSKRQKMLRELKDASKRLEEAIREAERKASEAAKAAAKKSKKTVVKYSGKSFRAIKGKLPWPVSGKVAIRYGRQKDPNFNTPVFRNGIYIKTKLNSTVSSVHRGKVIFADWFKGYGQLVIVNHGGGYNTLYANLSEIFLQTGDIIKDKKPIGRVGESTMLSAPSLYFEVRYKGKPLDPAQWLKRR